MLKLGSLFSGAGTFEFCGQALGIKPVWASEIEPFAIAVTHKNFPGMLHLGNIRNVDGAKIEPVDIITFGSPCQSASTAGLRKGLQVSCPECGWVYRGRVTDTCPKCSHKTDIAASALFFEAIRVIEEMLEATGGVYPKAILFENVVGILSSSNGEDFIRVLHELQHLGEGFILDPNILDASTMGVPQRRRRVYIAGINSKHIEVKYASTSDGKGTEKSEDSNSEDYYYERLQALADILERHTGSEGIPELLTDCDSLFRDFEKGRSAWKDDTTVVKTDIGETDRVVGKKVAYGVVTKGNGDAFIREETHASLTTGGGQAGQGYPCVLTNGGLLSHILRKLTTKECLSLQGLPTYWCDGLGNVAPTDAEISYWKEVFEEHRKTVNPKQKPKTEAQIRKWLSNPYSETAVYKLTGNGCASVQAHFCLKKIRDILI